LGSGSDRSQDEHDHGEHEGRQRHRQVLDVADAQVTDGGADEVGDQAGRGQDAERLEPEADQDPCGAGDLEKAGTGKKRSARPRCRR
jgi:hypothetical protein